MKVVKLMLLLISIMVFFATSCNNGKTKDDKQSSDTTNLTDKNGILDSVTMMKKAVILSDLLDEHCLLAGGMANFIITEANGRSMTQKFDEIYGFDSDHANIDALVRNFFVDACTIKAIATFLDTAVDISGKRKYDGIRIHLAASTIKDPQTYRKEPYQSKTGLYFYPTEKSKTTTQHNDKTEVLIPASLCANSPYIQPFHKTSSEVAVFENVYHRSMSSANPANKVLSRSVWIDSCVFKFMAALINLYNIDGFNIKTAAYLGTETTKPPLGKIARNQSTVIFVAVSNGAENWKIMNMLIGMKEKKWTPTKSAKSFLDVLNHGELCPSRCGD